MIFISYASKNEKIAEFINQKFKDEYIETWFAKEQIGTSENYAKKIKDAIKDATCIVLIFSKDANNSQHIPRELDLAIKSQKQIFPIRIEDCEPEEEMEYFLSTVQWFDAFDTTDKEIDNFVLSTLNNLGLKYDNRKYIDATNIDDFCIQHFKLMGYKTTLYAQDGWEDIAMVQNAIKKEPSKKKFILEFLDKNNAIYVNKKGTNRSLILLPKFIEKTTSSYLKALEASYFFEAKEVIYTDSFKKYLKEKFAHIDMDDESIDFKKKSLAADYFRGLSYQEQTTYSLLPIVFYQYIKVPPKFKKTTYTLPFEGNYEEGEKLSNLFLNFSKFPNWWGAKKDRLEDIRGNFYDGFTKAYEQLLYSDKFSKIVQKTQQYNHYNGRLAESLSEVFFNKNNLLVQNFGVEHVIGNALNFISRAQKVENPEAKKVITRFMSAPDLLIIKLDEQNKMVNSFFFDVKYRLFNSRNEFKKSLTQNNDLYKHAQKYHVNWDEVYLFLFAHFKNEHKTEVYILNVGEISNQKVQNPPSLKKDAEFFWFDDKSINDLYKYANLIWN